MTEVEEDEQSCEYKPESINLDPIAAKDTEMGEEKPREDNEEVDEEELEGDEQEEDGDEQTEDSEDDEQDKKLQHSLVDETNDGKKESHVEVSFIMNSDMNIDSTVDAVEDDRDLQAGNASSNVADDDSEEPVASLNCGLISIQQLAFNDGKGSTRHKTEEDVGVKADVRDSLNHQNVDDETISRLHTRSSPKAQPSPSKLEHKKEGVRNRTKIESGPAVVEDRNSSSLFMFDTDNSGGGDSGTEEEQAAFIIELRKFYKERALDFRPPKFYGVPLNLLKLWRTVLKLGGYDKVTACKDWRQVGESFNPPKLYARYKNILGIKEWGSNAVGGSSLWLKIPFGDCSLPNLCLQKTCTTISWTFRIFYEKALVDYERFRTSTDGTSLPGLSVPMGDESQAPGSGRARRDSAARAMQGWHSQRILDNGEVSDPIIKDKSSMPLSKKEKPLKSIGSILKRKEPSSTDDAVKSVQMQFPKIHSDATVIDIGSPADWVKINVRATRDCYEVYALVPGLLREEVRVQSDPAGRLVISGEPENPDNPWNVTPFKKVVSLPSRIDPHQTSAVVTLHGQLFVRVPFEHYD